MNILSRVALSTVILASSMCSFAQETTHISDFTYTLFSADFDAAGEHVLVSASGSPYGEVSVFEALPGSFVESIPAHPNFSYDAVYEPNGSRIATGGFDALVILWSDDSENDTLVGHTGDVLTLDWRENLIASGARDNSARVWNSATGESLHVFDGHLGPVNGVALSPDGSKLATACADGIVRIYDLATDMLQHELQGHFGAVTDVCFSPDGSKVASSSTDLSAKIWDATTGAEVGTLQGHNGEVTALDWVDNTIATSCGDALIRLYDATTLDEVTSLTGHLGRVSDVTIAKNDTRRLVSIGADKQCIVWYLENDALTTNTVVQRMLNFGSVETDEFRDTTVFLVNNTDETTELLEANISPVDTPFELLGNLPSAIAPQDSVAVVLRYSPSAIVSDSARLTVTAKNDITPFILTLNGMGAEPTSVDDVTTPLLVFPNPAQDVLFVQKPSTTISTSDVIRIVDVSGVVVLRYDVSTSSENLVRIETTSLVNGTYFVLFGNQSTQIQIAR